MNISRALVIILKDTILSELFTLITIFFNEIKISIFDFLIRD